MAVYAPEVEKTFFVYGGTTGPEDRYLLAMASYYDHKRHRVPRPTIVRDQRGIDDPHDNPSLTIDEAGYVWVFIARAAHAPGQGRSSAASSPTPSTPSRKSSPASKPTRRSGTFPERIIHLLTLYTGGRELYWETSRDGKDWTAQPAKDLKKLAGFAGHYQVSRCDGQKIGTAFNYHPGGKPDRRTNIYYAETADFGRTWTTVDGRPLTIPLDHPRESRARSRLRGAAATVLHQQARLRRRGPPGDPRPLQAAATRQEPGRRPHSGNHALDWRALACVHSHPIRSQLRLVQPLYQRRALDSDRSHARGTAGLFHRR